MLEQLLPMILHAMVPKAAIAAAAGGTVAGILSMAVYLGLLLASVIGLAVVIERLVRLRRGRLINAAMAKRLVEAMQRGDLTEAGALCAASRTVMARAFAVEIEEYRTGQITIEEAVAAVERMVNRRLVANLDILATTAKVAPLLGLLGTVLGMVFAFHQVDTAMRKETLAQGIVIALDTTVRGLCIAIVLLVFERHFYRRIDALIEIFDSLFTRLVRVARNPGAQPARPESKP